MNREDCFLLGYFSKVSGRDNRMVLQMETDTPDFYRSMTGLFADLNGTLTPFFVKSARVQPPSALVVEIEDIDENLAQELVGKEVFLPLVSLPRLKGKKFYFHEVVGYRVFDKQKGELGILESIYDRASQAVFKVMHEKTEILIPVADDLIERVDHENKELHLDCPEGLIDLYLGNPGEEEEIF